MDREDDIIDGARASDHSLFQDGKILEGLLDEQDRGQKAMTPSIQVSEVDIALLAPESIALIDRFALALKEKMRAAEMKHGWRTEWQTTDWADRCWNDLVRHLGKGDPRDVAIYAAFMWHHGWNTRAMKAGKESPFERKS